MARYIKISIPEKDNIYWLIFPQSLFEAIKLAWLTVKRRDNVAIVAQLPTEWVELNLRPLQED